MDEARVHVQRRSADLRPGQSQVTAKTNRINAVNVTANGALQESFGNLEEQGVGNTPSFSTARDRTW